MLNFLAEFGVTAAVFMVLDLIWLSVMGNRFYRPQLGPLMRSKIQPLPSLAFYVIYVAVVAIVVVHPALVVSDPNHAYMTGALVGLAAYATYNLTNAATLNGWPSLLTFVDLAWGVTVTTLASGIATTALIAMNFPR